MHPRGLIRRLEIGVEPGHRVHICPLPIGLRANLPARARPRRAPAAAAPAGRMPTANGLLHRLSAMPHSAIAQDGSALSVAPKPSMARRNSNEWSRATARLNCGCAAALQEVANDDRAQLFGRDGVIVVLCVRAHGRRSARLRPENEQKRAQTWFAAYVESIGNSRLYSDRVLFCALEAPSRLHNRW